MTDAEKPSPSQHHALEPSRLLFVYGTLMRGFQNKYAQILHSSATWLGSATFQGRLFRVGEYPAACDSSDVSDVVFGDVFAIQNAAVLQIIDEYEECGPLFSQPTEYVRVLRRIKRVAGDEVEAWIYLYNWDLRDAVPISSGRFVVPRP